MNINEHVESCLSFFGEEVGILDEILFIGAWARYFYRGLFQGEGRYQARLATKDLDILLSQRKKRAKRQVDVHKKLVESGYEKKFSHSGLIKYYRDALELEFLIPARGAPSDKPVNVEAYNLKAQELAYLEMLWRRPILVSYAGYDVRVPDPVDFAVQKLVISSRRAKGASAEQDRRDAEEVLYALSEKADFEMVVRERLGKLNRKQMQAVKKGISTFLVPELREKLQSFANLQG